MAKPGFDPLPDTARQDSLTHVDDRRSAESSENAMETSLDDGHLAFGAVMAEEAVPATSAEVVERVAEQVTNPDGVISVQVCYATPDAQTIITLSVASPCTVNAVLRASGIVGKHPEIDLSVQSVGIFGKIKQLDDLVAAEDRIEIYRPLIVDPKVARARRVAKTRKGGSSEGRKWSTRARRSL